VLTAASIGGYPDVQNRTADRRTGWFGSYSTISEGRCDKEFGSSFLANNHAQKRAQFAENNAPPNRLVSCCASLTDLWSLAWSILAKYMELFQILRFGRIFCMF